VFKRQQVTTWANGGLQDMKIEGNTVSFAFRKGFLPKPKQHIRELRVVGIPCILVYDEDDRCVGVVFSHDEKDSLAYGQAIIGFYEEYQKEFGQWHRIFLGTNRLQYAHLHEYLETNGEYRYMPHHS